MIENRNLSAGTRLVANYKKQRYVCTVEAGEDGLVYVLEDGTKHKSPSAAGSKVMGGKAVNGWRFWSVEGAQPEGAAAASTPPTKSRRTTTQKLIYRIPNQQGVAEGMAKYFCTACMKSFVVEAGETPEVCPEGHRNDDAELTAPAGAEASSE